jgi:hypothetical protein
MDMNAEWVGVWKEKVDIYLKVLSIFTWKDRRKLRKIPGQPIFCPTVGAVFSENKCDTLPLH